MASVKKISSFECFDAHRECDEQTE